MRYVDTCQTNQPQIKQLHHLQFPRVLAGEDLGAVELGALEDLHQFSFLAFSDERRRRP